MKRAIVLFFMVGMITAFATPAHAFQNKVLILFDDERESAQFLAHENTLANLMGHFNLEYVHKNIMFYRKGNINNYKATFYIGNKPSNILPESFLEDVLSAKRPIIWIDRNLKKIATGAYKARFEKTYRIRYVGYVGSKEPFKTVKYAGKRFTRIQYYITRVRSLDFQRAKIRSRAYSASSWMPHIINSGNFWYVAENPLEIWQEDQSYIVFTELLHDMVRIRHAYRKKALVRIEDVDAEDDPDRLKAIADYLYSVNVPFSVAVVPRFTDPLGATGPVRTIDLNDRPLIVDALKYMEARGGVILMHGFTHQYDSVANPFNGVSGSDAEFYIQRFVNGQIKSLSPVPNDSASFARDRVNSANNIFLASGFAKPKIWVTPNYIASHTDYFLFGEMFSALYERLPSAYFPYMLYTSNHHVRMIPENLGFIIPGQVPPSTIISRADKNLVVRDGFASFFFHPEFELGLLMQTVQGIKDKGYRFVGVNSLL